MSSDTKPTLEQMASAIEERLHAHENILAAIMRALPQEQQEKVRELLEQWIQALPDNSDRRETLTGLLVQTIYLPPGKSDPLSRSQSKRDE